MGSRPFRRPHPLAPMPRNGTFGATIRYELIQTVPACMTAGHTGSRDHYDVGVVGRVSPLIDVTPSKAHQKRRVEEARTQGVVSDLLPSERMKNSPAERSGYSNVIRFDGC